MLKATTITTENAKFHCRTCLIILPFDDDVDGEGGRKPKIFDITASLQQLILVNSEFGAGDDATNAQYPRSVCQNCFKKLHIIKKFRKQVQQSSDTLHSVFGDVIKDEEDEMPLLTRSKMRKNAADLLSQALLESESVTLYEEDALSNVTKFDINSLDPFSDNDDNSAHRKTKSIAEFKEEPENEVSDNDDAWATDSDRDYVPSMTNAAALTNKKRGPKNCRGLKRSRVAGIRCETCKRRFVHKYHYDAHMLREHEGAERPYVCDQCAKDYKTISALRYHKIVAHKLDTTPFPCNFCSKQYKTAASLKNHKRELHLNQKRAKSYVCEHCGAAFINNKTLSIHMSAKHAIGDCDTEFKCDQCEKLFQSPYTLKYHVLTVHLQERNCECGVCGAGFAKKFMLIQHMRSHSSDQDRHPCDKCDKRFQSKSDVQRHIQVVHLKIKPFNCNHCGESFGSGKTLRFHTYIHTREKPYICDFCGVRFRQPTAMKTHHSTHFKKLQANAAV